MPSISVAVTIAVTLFVVVPPAANQTKPPSKPAALASVKSFVGSDVCMACHQEVFDAFQKNSHKSVDFDKARGRENHACEGCHGPGSSHAETLSVDEIVNPARLPAAKGEETCLACHRNQRTHIGRLQNSHARNSVPCTTCHRIHQTGAESLAAGKATTINQQCAGCHLNEWAALQRPYAHRLPQGSMSCVDCHNPHGSLLASQLRTFAANEPNCLSCHTDLRGPFTYEHAPMRAEGCQACHEPHGSANPKMLTRAEVRFVCLECHANLPRQPATAVSTIGVVPPSFHDLRSPRYRNCTTCHQKIHGSHVDRNLLR